MTSFDAPWETSLLKTLWEKEKLLVITSNFSFFHNVFYQLRELFAIYIKFKIVSLLTVSIWTSLKFCRLVMG